MRGCVSHLGPSLRRAARPRSTGRRVLVALALSVLVNLFLVTRLDLSWLSALPGPAEPVSLSALSARDWEANRTVGKRPAPAEKAPAPAPQKVVVVPPAQAPGQVVRATPPAVPPKEPPKNARYLAEHDSVVEKETKARGVGDGNPRTPPPPQAARPLGGLAGRPDARPDASPAEQRAEQRPEPERPRERQAEQERPRLALNFTPRPDVREAERMRKPQASAPAPGEAGPQGQPGADGSRHTLDLHPSAALYDPPQVAGTGGTPDYLPGVEEGNGTFLNTREWKYAGFFNRIMAEVRPNWVRELTSAVDARDPTRQAFMYKDRETVIAVRLDGKGQVADIRVVQSSGVPFLDDAVVKAWKQSQPFVNVPQGLMNDRGEVAFSAGFIALGVNGSPVQLFLGPGY